MAEMRAELPGLSRRGRRLLLAVVGLALMMVVSAVSGLNVALPSLARDTGASQSELQWIVDAYTMVFAGLLLPAGAIGDRYGRRGILLAGLVIFGTAAALAMALANPTALIVLRAVMGAGAALVMPTTLSIITSSFPEEEKATAVGVWAGIAGGGAVLGVLGSGVLLVYFGWSSIFGLNVALAVVAFAAALAVVPQSRESERPSLDVAGSVLALVGVSGLVFGFIEGADRGWGDPLVDFAFAVGLASLAAFVVHGLRVERPMLDPRLFRLRGFGTGALSISVQFFSAFGFFFIAPQYLQFVVGMSPLRAAACLLPLPVVLVPLSRRAPAIARRFGINRVGALGLALIAVGLGIISHVGVDLSYWVFAAGTVVFGAGMALAGTPATTAIVSSLPRHKQGVASAVNDVSREFGSALGIAVLGSVLKDRYRSGVANAVSGLPSQVAERAQSSIAYVQQMPVQQLGSAGPHLQTTVQQAFVNAASTALLVAAAILLCTAVYVLVRAPRRDAAATDALRLPGGSARQAVPQGDM